MASKLTALNEQQVSFRPAAPTDLQTLIEIENLGFTPEEAATPESMSIRIEKIPDTFIVVELISPELTGVPTPVIAGFIDGPVVHKRYITDDLFDTVVENPTQGGYQCVLGIAVHPNFRKLGLGSKLVQELIRISMKTKRDAITLTCRDMLIPFYTLLGFKNEGESESTHGGYVWYNMVYQLADQQQS